MLKPSPEFLQLADWRRRVACLAVIGDGVCCNRLLRERVIRECGRSCRWWRRGGNGLWTDFMMMPRRFPSPRHAIAFNLGFFFMFFLFGFFWFWVLFGCSIDFFWGFSYLERIGCLLSSIFTTIFLSVVAVGLICFVFSELGFFFPNGMFLPLFFLGL